MTPSRRILRDSAVPNMQRLQAACRRGGIEALYTTIESLTRDGRDRSLDCKISGLRAPKGSWDARVIDAIVPEEDEIVLPKTSSVFISTNIDHVLCNLGARFLIVAGVLTGQCIDSAMRVTSSPRRRTPVRRSARAGTTGRCAAPKATAASARRRSW